VPHFTKSFDDVSALIFTIKCKYPIFQMFFDPSHSASTIYHDSIDLFNVFEPESITRVYIWNLPKLTSIESICRQ